MDELRIRDTVEQALAVLREGFEGPPGDWSYFTDLGRKAGLFGTLERLSADAASRDVGGTSIAAHAYHVAFGLEVATDWIRGDREPRDWRASWDVREVTEKGWAALQGRLQELYAELRGAIEERAGSGVESYGGALGAIAHLAYHLGAIRQKELVLEGSTDRSAT